MLLKGDSFAEMLGAPAQGNASTPSHQEINQERNRSLVVKCRHAADRNMTFSFRSKQAVSRLVHRFLVTTAYPLSPKAVFCGDREILVWHIFSHVKLKVLTEKDYLRLIGNVRDMN